VKSLNFEFLRPDWPELASLAGFAEQYALADPASGLVKLRSFAELLVEIVYDKFALQRPPQARLMDLLCEDSFKQAVPQVVVNILDAIRIHGNKAAHGATGSTSTALWLLKESHRLGQWLYLTLTGKSQQDIPAYQEPTSEQISGKSKAELKREKAAVLQRLAAQEAQMQKLLDDLAAARQEATRAKATEAELQARLQAAQTSVNVLDFNEAETRRLLIDTQLSAAGWDVGPGRQSTAEVGKEVPVSAQPTESGVGYVDYLMNDEPCDKPLGLIEAKRTAVNPEAGRTQAKCYADGVEHERGQRPVIFYSNGFDTWIWDDASRWTPRKIYGFYSKDSLQYLIRQRTERQDLTKILPNPEIAGRLYQIRAVTGSSSGFRTAAVKRSSSRPPAPARPAWRFPFPKS
jgi:type I restriction enzyme, R subunit